MSDYVFFFSAFICGAVTGAVLTAFTIGVLAQ